MESPDLHDLVSDLSTNITTLETALTPLTRTSLPTTSSKLPLLDKAKLHVLATYALESILFNSLRLNGTDAKAHPVFPELNRVKEYFGKIKAAEGKGVKGPTARVDREAVGRFVKAGLAGNKGLDRERKEGRAREKAGAKRKLEDMGSGVGTATRFEGAAKRARVEDQLVSEPIEGGQGVSEEEADEGGVALGESGAVKKPKRKNKPTDPEKKALKRERRAEAKEAKLSPHGSSDATPHEREKDEDGEAATSNDQHRARNSKAPKSSKEALESLLDGASSKLEKKGNKRKKRSKGQALEDERPDETK